MTQTPPKIQLKQLDTREYFQMDDGKVYVVCYKLANNTGLICKEMYPRRRKSAIELPKETDVHLLSMDMWLGDDFVCRMN